MSKYDVTEDRNKYIGGSDIPIIMGLSKFKTRWELLQEKAGLIEPDFEENAYTEFGETLEPQIRDAINKMYEGHFPLFEEHQKIVGKLRYHADGFNGERVLEIKTTSQIKESLEGYKSYLVQLLFGMDLYNVNNGVLAVYERPDDFDTTFDPFALTMYGVNMQDHAKLTDEIGEAIKQFQKDLEKVKANPLITEEELQPTALIELSDKVVALEQRLAEYKSIEKEQKEMKEALKVAMEEYGVKKWTTNNGVQITLVPDAPDKRVYEKVIDYAGLQEAYSKLCEHVGVPERCFVREVDGIKKGRKGYVKITL